MIDGDQPDYKSLNENARRECNRLRRERDEARAELAAERERADKAEADNAFNFEAAQRECGEKLAALDALEKCRALITELWDGAGHLAWKDEMDEIVAEALAAIDAVIPKNGDGDE